MFPDFTFQETTQDTDVGRSIIFEVDKQKFQRIDGKTMECTGIEAVKQWCELLLHTKRGKFAIYSESVFGISIDKLIGVKTLPEPFLISELKREILEGLALCPAIERADSFHFERERRAMNVSFTVYLYNGESAEVTTYVGG